MDDGSSSINSTDELASKKAKSERKKQNFLLPPPLFELPAKGPPTFMVDLARSNNMIKRPPHRNG